MKLKLAFWILLGLGVVFGIAFNFPQAVDSGEFVAHLDDSIEIASLSDLFMQPGTEELLNTPIPVKLLFPERQILMGSGISPLFMRLYESESGRIHIHVRSSRTGVVSFYEIAYEPGAESQARQLRNLIRAEFPNVWSRVQKL